VSAFGAAARRLAGVSAWLLGWRPAEFWAATPDELEAVFAAARGEAAQGAPLKADELARLKEMFPDG
jgi:hypothetical protein